MLLRVFCVGTKEACILDIRCVMGNWQVTLFCSEDVKNCLFQSYCANVYAGPLWCIYKRTTYKKSVVAYNDVYRSLFSIKRGTSISAIYVQNDLSSFNVIMRKLSYGLKCRLEASDNVLIKGIISSLFYMSKSSLTKRWRDNLYVSGLSSAKWFECNHVLMSGFTVIPFIQVLLCNSVVSHYLFIILI